MNVSRYDACLQDLILNFLTLARAAGSTGELDEATTYYALAAQCRTLLHERIPRPTDQRAADRLHVPALGPASAGPFLGVCSAPAHAIGERNT